jgi:TonB-linked SusC/RagA family outer membrane protein
MKKNSKLLFLSKSLTKISLIMKLSVLISLVATIQISANTYSQATRVSINVTNVDIRDAFREIERNSGLSFLYYEKALDLQKTISVNVKNSSVPDLLDELLQGTQLTYKILDNKFIVISPANVMQQKVTGTVTDVSTGEPLPGVSIQVEGTTNGVISDVIGRYSIDVPNASAILIFSYVGYLTERITASGPTIDVKLAPDVQKLQEVVVTAMGIKREKKALSYSSQQISQEELSKGRNLNFIEGLNGKAAGVDVRQSSAGAGGSTRIQMRGTHSIFGSSQPLFVIDGIPMPNTQTSDPTGFFGGFDSGDGLSSLNPDDIESMNILKGANAAALYGSQGSNGVIVITTKKGIKGRVKVEISSSTSFQTASILPKLQTSYGQTTTGANDSWGPKGSYSNPVDGFFRTGIDLLNSISISGGNEITTAYLSCANSNSRGIMPTNLFDKNNLTFKQTTRLSKKIDISTNIMLSDQKIHNKTMNGYYFNPLTGLYLFPRGLDFDAYKSNYQLFDPARNFYATQNWWDDEDTQQNPYWILNNDVNNEDTKQVLASIDLSYKLTNSLSIQARGSYDYTAEIFEQDIQAGTQSTLSSPNGRWIYSNRASNQQYADLILNYNKDFNNIFDVHGILGTSYQKKVIGDGTFIDTNRSGLIIPNGFFLNNIRVADPTSGQSTWNGTLESVITSRDIKESVFANFSVGYKKMIYLDLSGRNEWSSTLSNTPTNNYFYPSIGVSALINEMVTLPQVINFAKLRASYSYVGKEIPAFRTVPLNTVSQGGGTVYKTQEPLNTLKPELQKNLELGAEMKFLDTRVGFEATYYYIDNTNEFLRLLAPKGSGFQYYFANLGEFTNKGFEVTLTIIPLKSKNLTWKSDINYATNKNKILKLDPTLNGVFALDGGGDGFDMKLKEGGSIGDLYINKMLRDSVNGKLILNDSNLPQLDPKGTKYVGSTNHDFSLSWNNTVTYKNLSLSFLIDGKFGGKFVDASEAWYDQRGVSQRSADARNAGSITVIGENSAGTPVLAKVSPKDYYKAIGGRGNQLETYTYDATNVRLRQVAITYNLNLARYHILIENASFSLIGRNLLFFYRPAPFDPDNSISTGINSQSVENFSLPPTRSIGFNIKLNF